MKRPFSSPVRNTLRAVSRSKQHKNLQTKLHIDELEGRYQAGNMAEDLAAPLMGRVMAEPFHVMTMLAGNAALTSQHSPAPVEEPRVKSVTEASHAEAFVLPARST